MRTATTSVLPIASVLICAAPALAQAPVALVEEVRGRPAGIELMDYVSAGKVIKLGRQDSIVLGYLRSCWHETITGGTVIVGAEQSDVRGGEVVRSKVKCDGGNIALTPGQANQSAGTSYRDAESETDADAVRALSGHRSGRRLRSAGCAHRSTGRISRCQHAGEAGQAAIFF